MVCPGCGCVCDDLRLTFDGERLVGFDPPCPVGQQWFAAHAAGGVSPARVSGSAVEFSAAIEHAAVLLRDCDYPLVYGLSRSSTPGQRAAVALGESLGGVVDTTASLCHGPSIMALQEVGEVTCTLGEIRNRADLVIFWGCNPTASHPRHAERYSVEPRGRWVPHGRPDRKVVMIGSAEQISDWQIDSRGTQPDLRIAIDPGRDFEAIALLRQLLAQPAAPSACSQVRAGTNASAELAASLHQLMELIRASRYGVVFFGLGLAGNSSWGQSIQSNVGHINVAALLQLVAELNAVTRFTARRMRLQGDVSGADNVLCWQTGYPFAVDFARGYPRYNPGEYSANELLERGDVDLCLLIGGETIAHFSAQALQHLRSIPVIWIDYPGTTLPWVSQVQFTTAVYGLHASGTIYRMDNVPLSLHSLVATNLPTDEQVLQRLQARYQELAAPPLR